MSKKEVVVQLDNRLEFNPEETYRSARKKRIFQPPKPLEEEFFDPDGEKTIQTPINKLMLLENDLI